MASNIVYSHSPQLFRPAVLRKKVAAARTIVKRLKPDVIMCRGFSGAGLAFPLSYSTGVPVGLVRSVLHQHHPDITHARTPYEGPEKFNTFVIVDDFTDTGRTLEYIKEHSQNAKCLACIFYTNTKWNESSRVSIAFGSSTECLYV